MSVYVCLLNTPIKSKLIAFNDILLNLKGITSNIFKQFILLRINICFYNAIDHTHWCFFTEVFMSCALTKQLLISIRTQLQRALESMLKAIRLSSSIVFLLIRHLSFFILFTLLYTNATLQDLHQNRCNPTLLSYAGATCHLQQHTH